MGACPTACYGAAAAQLVDTPCDVDTDAQWFCSGPGPDYDLLNANCEDAALGTPQPSFCCPLAFYSECLAVN
jgi:hypothetical protein